MNQLQFYNVCCYCDQPFRHLIGVCTVCHSSITVLDTLTGSRVNFFKYFDKHGKELTCLNTVDKYSIMHNLLARQMTFSDFFIYSEAISVSP